MQAEAEPPAAARRHQRTRSGVDLRHQRGKRDQQHWQGIERRQSQGGERAQAEGGQIGAQATQRRDPRDEACGRGRPPLPLWEGVGGRGRRSVPSDPSPHPLPQGEGESLRCRR